jgi:hypothetical protein
MNDVLASYAKDPSGSKVDFYAWQPQSSPPALSRLYEWGEHQSPHSSLESTNIKKYNNTFSVSYRVFFRYKVHPRFLTLA